MMDAEVYDRWYETPRGKWIGKRGSNDGSTEKFRNTKEKADLLQDRETGREIFAAPGLRLYAEIRMNLSE